VTVTQEVRARVLLLLPVTGIVGVHLHHPVEHPDAGCDQPEPDADR